MSTVRTAGYEEVLTKRSIHLYTGFGPRDRSQTEREYGRAVYGPDAAEYSIEVCKGLINKAVSRWRMTWSIGIPVDRGV